MLSYPRLPHPVFTDTMFTGTVSKSGNMKYQVYGTSFFCMRLLPIKLKNDTHNTITLIFKRDGVPPETIMDNSKEKLAATFLRNSKRLNDIRRQSKPTGLGAQPTR